MNIEIIGSGLKFMGEEIGCDIKDNVLTVTSGNFESLVTYMMPSYKQTDDKPVLAYMGPVDEVIPYLNTLYKDYDAITTDGRIQAIHSHDKTPIYIPLTLRGIGLTRKMPNNGKTFKVSTKHFSEKEIMDKLVEQGYKYLRSSKLPKQPKMLHFYMK